MNRPSPDRGRIPAAIGKPISRWALALVGLREMPRPIAAETSTPWNDRAPLHPRFIQRVLCFDRHRNAVRAMVGGIC
jgi:hypothetical protein